eukprot:7562971-Alexandrium_andersonii.AAC.1
MRVASPMPMSAMLTRKVFVPHQHTRRTGCFRALWLFLEHCMCCATCSTMRARNSQGGTRTLKA